MVREKFMKIIISPTEELGKKTEEFNNEIKKYLVPIKPGRNYPRKKMYSMNKYSHNLRKNCQDKKSVKKVKYIIYLFICDTMLMQKIKGA